MRYQFFISPRYENDIFHFNHNHDYHSLETEVELDKTFNILKMEACSVNYSEDTFEDDVQLFLTNQMKE